MQVAAEIVKFYLGFKFIIIKHINSLEQWAAYVLSSQLNFLSPLGPWT